MAAVTEDWSGDTPGAGLGAGNIDTPEIKLFGKWSSSDVQVSDISLTVSHISIMYS
jgi:hypothetical protein